MVKEMPTMIFCLGCSSYKSQLEAKIIFKTGFYKTTIPLGYCTACSEAELAMDAFLADASAATLEASLLQAYGH
ncbi:hypothetical protein [Paenibacillus ferrarius]|uniref:hypothetical protein n=1 Tax=Paenibacillus ferrarius TaxID=1469647 RepID=UPI003D266614